MFPSYLLCRAEEFCLNIKFFFKIPAFFLTDSEGPYAKNVQNSIFIIVSQKLNVTNIFKKIK